MMTPLIESRIIDHFHALFTPILRLTPEEVHWVGERIPIPSFSLEQIEELLDETFKILDSEKQPFQDVPLPAWILGDIHGNFHDLLRALTTVHDFIENRIAFLGDYVDRGSFSLDCVLLVFTLKCVHPQNIFLLRGNHEFATVNREYGFGQEIDDRFPDSDLFDRINDIFSRLPLAFRLGQIAICLHGGIGPQCQSLADIARIPYPVAAFEPGDIVTEIVWSDPTPETAMFIDSSRGCGVLFGRRAASIFVKSAGFSKLIRGHECVQSGLHNFGVVTTIFSSSNYCGHGNTAAFVFMDESGEIDKKTLEPLTGLVDREGALYGEVNELGAVATARRTELRARRLMFQPLVRLDDKLDKKNGHIRGQISARAGLMARPVAKLHMNH
jgi:diadenosine tetraphosphatase ApaH/serine/threonine PP2A family protein phosphatase